MGVMAGGTITLGGLGLLFTGTDKLDDIKDFASDASSRLVQFEDNENSLLEKLGLIKEDAKSKLTASAAQIKELEKQKGELDGTVEGLNGQITDLNTQIAGLKESLTKEQGDHTKTKVELAKKTEEYNAKVTELEVAKKTQKELEGMLKLAYEKSQEGDKLVKQLEGELEKANAEVDVANQAVEAEKAKATEANPLTQEEIDAISTTVEADVTVENSTEEETTTEEPSPQSAQ